MSIVEIFLKTNVFNMLFFLLRPLTNSSGILLGLGARLDRHVARFFLDDMKLALKIKCSL